MVKLKIVRRTGEQWESHSLTVLHRSHAHALMHYRRNSRRGVHLIYDEKEWKLMLSLASTYLPTCHDGDDRICRFG